MLFSKLIFLTALRRQWPRIGEGLMLELGNLALLQQGNYTEDSSGEWLLRETGKKVKSCHTRKCAVPYWRSVYFFLSPVAYSNILFFLTLTLHIRWPICINLISFSSLLTGNPASFFPPLPRNPFDQYEVFIPVTFCWIWLSWLLIPWRRIYPEICPFSLPFFSSSPLMLKFSFLFRASGLRAFLKELKRNVSHWAMVDSLQPHGL